MADGTIIGGGSDETNPGEQTPEEKAAAEDKASAEAKAAEEGKSPEEIKAAEEKAAAEEGKSPEEIKAAEEGKSPEEIKAAEEKAAEEKKEGAPEEYTDFNMPEGMEVDKGMMEKFTVRAKDRNLSQEEAQKDIDLYAEGLKASVDAHVKDWADAMGKWQDDTKADKEIGGDRFSQTEIHVNAALKAFGTEKLSEILEVTGVGNHVEVVRFFDKVGALVTNDKIDLGNVRGEGDKTQAETMYPNQGGSA